jgi:hypothetical protein
MTNAAASHAACKRSKCSENAHSSLVERRATGEREGERERGDPRFWRAGRNVRGLFLGPWGCSFCDTRHEE